MSEGLQHLVLVRHGESEGDVRRAAVRRGEDYHTTKTPDQEELTNIGEKQSYQSGLYIKQQILGKFAIQYFDYYYVSSALRAEQSAVAMDLPNALWQEDPRLNERDRGLIRGMPTRLQQEKFPDAYRQMQKDPLYSHPPEGQSIDEICNIFVDFYNDLLLSGDKNVIVVGHRDAMWAAQRRLEALSDEELLAVNTDDIHNGQMIHYMSLDPITGKQVPDLMFKCSVDPMHPEDSTGWQILPNIAARYGYVWEG